MKTALLSLLLLFTTIRSQAQTCEEREDRLLEMVGTFSAGMLYNTYAAIGAIADGYVHNAYDAGTVKDLLQAQQQLTENISKVIQKMLDDKMLKDNADVEYLRECQSIMKGLRNQARYFSEYAETKITDRQQAYDDQRSKNWKAISKLMGMEDEEE